MTNLLRRRVAGSAALAALALAAAGAAAQGTAPTVGDDGVIRIKSGYPLEETVDRLRKDIAAKGIVLFQVIDQADLAAKAGITLRPSTLLIFGNPPLGAQFLTANPNAGLDWPVRLLVAQDADGAVWVAWTDFAWIARRHRIEDRGPQFAMATGVVESITASVRAR